MTRSVIDSATGASPCSSPAHEISKSIVSGAGKLAVLRATCTCGDFVSDAARLSTPGRRKQQRLISEHLSAAAIEAMP